MRYWSMRKMKDGYILTKKLKIKFFSTGDPLIGKIGQFWNYDWFTRWICLIFKVNIIMKIMKKIFSENVFVNWNMTKNIGDAHIRHMHIPKFQIFSKKYFFMIFSCDNILRKIKFFMRTWGIYKAYFSNVSCWIFKQYYWEMKAFAVQNLRSEKLRRQSTTDSNKPQTTSVHDFVLFFFFLL